MEHATGIVMPLLRYALIAVAAYLVTTGSISAEQFQSLMGWIIGLGTSGWLVYNKKVKGV